MNQSSWNMWGGVWSAKQNMKENKRKESDFWPLVTQFNYRRSRGLTACWYYVVTIAAETTKCGPSFVWIKPTYLYFHKSAWCLNLNLWSDTWFQTPAQRFGWPWGPLTLLWPQTNIKLILPSKFKTAHKFDGAISRTNINGNIGKHVCLAPKLISTQ